jgi:hypothetical protein
MNFGGRSVVVLSAELFSHNPERLRKKNILREENVQIWMNLGLYEVDELHCNEICAMLRHW